MSSKKSVLGAAIAGALTVTLAGCSSGSDFVACHGVVKKGAKESYVVMDKGLCSKLAGGVAQPLPAGVKKPTINPNNYVKCYGVAAAGKNDCGTKTTACAGSVKVAKAPDAWVTALEGVCKQVGGKVGKVGNKKA